MVYTLSGIRLPSAPFVHKLSGSTSNGDRKNINLSCFLKKHSSSLRSSNDSDSPSSVVAASEKVLVPGGHVDDSLSSTDILEVAEKVSGDPLSSTDQLEVPDIVPGGAQLPTSTACIAITASYHHNLAKSNKEIAVAEIARFTPSQEA
ncbi:hypothetical protein Acr_08g0018210 [Actinidia rufa]|uniref:Uncharacterized protein n=1 Tax=Actinidia rufa TaxID=165716 RepID=A0A7J0F413_9ERIC|nr:hypothetical protein Acr_08g0018210 [Actinidia rufa]